MENQWEEATVGGQIGEELYHVPPCLRNIFKFLTTFTSVGGILTTRLSIP